MSSLYAKKISQDLLSQGEKMKCQLGNLLQSSVEKLNGESSQQFRLRI